MLQSKSMNETIKTALISLFPEIVALYVFGSAAKGELTNESDIDIALLSEKKIEKHRLLDAKTILTQKLNRDIDLIDLNSENLVFQYEILKTGKKLFSSNQLKTDQIELRLMTMYLDFQDMRKDLLTQIKQRGSIYG